MANVDAGCVVQEEVSTIMRYLGAYPTEKAMVKDILPDMQVRKSCTTSTGGTKWTTAVQLENCPPVNPK